MGRPPEDTALTRYPTAGTKARESHQALEPGRQVSQQKKETTECTGLFEPECPTRAPKQKEDATQMPRPQGSRVGVYCRHQPQRGTRLHVPSAVNASSAPLPEQS